MRYDVPEFPSLSRRTVAIGLIVPALLLALITFDVVVDGPLTRVDRQANQWMDANELITLTGITFVITQIGDDEEAAWIAGIALAFLAFRKKWYWFLSGFLAFDGAHHFNTILKNAVTRSRPPNMDSVMADVANPLSYAFPSGHTMTAAVLFGWFAVYAAYHLSGWQRRSALVSLLCVPLIVGFTRVYLSAHYITDAVAAFAAAAIWLLISMGAVSVLRIYVTELRGERVLSVVPAPCETSAPPA